MMNELEYPLTLPISFRSAAPSARHCSQTARCACKKRIAVLGGSTTSDIVKTLELFLLNAGIEPTFYESEYAQYFQDAMFPR